MRRLRVRSLAGQMVLLVGAALLIAQLANFALILNERQKLSLSRNQGPGLTTLASVAADYEQTPADLRPALLADNSRRGVRLSADSASGIRDAERDADLEDRVQDALKESGANPSAVVASSASDRQDRRGGQMLRVALRNRSDGQWLTARIYTPRGDPWLGARLLIATMLLFLLVLGASIWLAIRIARPMRDLATAAESFQGRADLVDIPATGPEDVRRAILAFNAMRARVSGLLAEKDVMLGAIGHDLRTPLASVKIRLESMEPEAERIAAAATLAEMNRTLENILTLARTGRAQEEARRTDVSALVEAMVDEYQDRGEAVTFTASAREVAPVHPDMLRQALRNIIDNALKYAGNAELSLAGAPKSLTIAISDRGPGIPEADHLAVLLPFHRLEASRNRQTGGSGLGLAIAKSITELHGGALTLSSVIPQGLRVEISIPR